LFFIKVSNFWLINEFLILALAKFNGDLMVYNLFEVRVADFIFNDKNELLLLKNNKGTWGILGGHLDKGEQIRDTVHREAMEEAGIKIDIRRQFGLRVVSEKNSVVISFSCRYVSGEIKLQKDEVSEFAWVTLDELKNYKLTFDDLPALAKKALQVVNRK
jgi:NADH pyrophosphatase NudC (nudix superfamily)